MSAPDNTADRDWRVVMCDACGGEGRLYHRGYAFSPYTDEEIGGWIELCECCEGTGGELIPVEPIEEGDLP